MKTVAVPQTKLHTSGGKNLPRTEVPQDKQTDSELKTLLNEMHAMRERVHNVEEDMKEVKKQMTSLVRGLTLHPLLRREQKRE